LIQKGLQVTILFRLDEWVFLLEKMAKDRLLQTIRLWHQLRCCY
jgi:hypothetical protein